MNLLDRIVVARSGCWLWTGSLTHNGYGRVQRRVDGRNRTVRAHRLVYESLVGPIPDGMELDHLCRVRRCVNPEHLEPVTHAENQRRMAEARTHCFRGHAFTAENTYINKRGGRVCRTCRSATQRTWYERQAS